MMGIFPIAYAEDFDDGSFPKKGLSCTVLNCGMVMWCEKCTVVRGQPIYEGYSVIVVSENTLHYVTFVTSKILNSFPDKIKIFRILSNAQNYLSKILNNLAEQEAAKLGFGLETGVWYKWSYGGKIINFSKDGETMRCATDKGRSFDLADVTKTPSQSNVPLISENGNINPIIEKLIRFTISQWISTSELRLSDHSSLVDDWLENDFKEWANKNDEHA